MPSESLARDRARRLRTESTDAARRLWSRLRNRHLGAKFRREYSIGPYFADFCCLEAHLVIEVDGGQHNELHQRRYDEERTRYFEQCGFRVIRFWDGEVLKETDAVIDRILMELSEASNF